MDRPRQLSKEMFGVTCQCRILTQCGSGKRRRSAYVRVGFADVFRLEQGREVQGGAGGLEPEVGLPRWGGGPRRRRGEWGRPGAVARGRALEDGVERAKGPGVP